MKKLIILLTIIIISTSCSKTIIDIDESIITKIENSTVKENYYLYELNYEYRIRTKNKFNIGDKIYFTNSKFINLKSYQIQLKDSTALLYDNDKLIGRFRINNELKYLIDKDNQ